jgi:hypothetical protein
MTLLKIIPVLIVFFGVVFIYSLVVRGGVFFYCINNDACDAGGYCHAWFTESSWAATPIPATFFHPGYCVYQEENSTSLPPPV